MNFVIKIFLTANALHCKKYIYIPGEPKLSDYFVLVVTLKPINIKQQIKNVMIAEFMEI